MPRSVYACYKVFQSICSVFCNFMSLLFFLSPCVSSRVLPSTCPPCFCGYEICDTAAAAPLQKLRTQKQICGEKWTGSERDWRPSWSCDAVTSTPAPLAPYQPARPPDSSDWTGSITVSGWNRLRCCFYYIRLLHSPSSLLPPPRCPAPSLRPLLVIYLLWAFLIWARVAHHCSQRVCLREWKLLFYSLRIYGLLTRCLHERAASRGQKLLRAASSSLNLVQMNRILFRNMFQNIQNFLSAALVSWHDH